MITVNKPVEYWDSLQTKEDLYAQFDNLAEVDKGSYATDDMSTYFEDSEFKVVAEKLEAGAKALRPVLLDVASHYTTIGEICHNEAIDKVNALPLDTMENIAVYAKTMYLMLDGSNDNSFIKRIASGSGIPEARAACRAYARYKVFKDKENERMAAFRLTAEYRMQQTELKLGLRDKFELPELPEDEVE